MGITLTLPTPGDHATNGLWGAILNTALQALADCDQFKRKSADESVTSSTTLQNDDDLVVPVVASGVYLVTWDLKTDGAAAGDIKYAFTGPASAAMTWDSVGLDVAAASNVAGILQDAAAIGTVITHGTVAAGTPSHIRGNGILVVSATAGNLTLQWAQATSSGTATKVQAGSWLLARRVA